MDMQTKRYLSRHEQEAWLRNAPAVVTFDYFNGDEVVRSASYLVGVERQSLALPTVVKTARWRYMITLDEAPDSIDRTNDGPNSTST